MAKTFKAKGFVATTPTPSSPTQPAKGGQDK